MKLKNYSRYDWLLQIVVLPLFILILNWLLIGEEYWQNTFTLVLASAITVANSFMNWFVNNLIALNINQLYPDPRQYIPRVLRRFAACAVSSSLHVILLFFIYWAISLPGFEPDVARLGLGLLYTAIIVAIVIITYEGMDNFDKWQQTRQEVDTLTKAQLQAQLDALRQQVNPHFLFNSLNSLISLISEDPRQAEIFAEELSTVYRYLLRSNESPLTPLSTELDFIHSYFQLLKTRYGEALKLEIRVGPDEQARQLPPLTLQLLIENAVKHNIILPEQPLIITLTTDEMHRLVVRNNVQLKPSRALSNGIGLSNILTKYQVLDKPAPTVEDDGREFRVILPLM